MFQFPGFAPARLCIQRVVALFRAWVVPFGNLRLNACVAAPRSLSQLPTSFIASWYLGIHRVPLVAWPSLTQRRLFTPPAAWSTPGRNAAPQLHSHSLDCQRSRAADAVTTDRPVDELSKPHLQLKEHPCVEDIGFEPMTPAMQRRCSPN